MASSREKDGRTIFIGNMQYDVSEEQVIELFKTCGTVVSFRMVHDKETGRSKGYGFLEYRTADEAKTAKRNLDNYVFFDRTLKVDWSNASDKGGKKAGNTNGVPSSAGDGALPALPPGVELAPGLTAPDAISLTLSNIPTPQLLDILSQMKALVTSDPAKATTLLQQAPQLAYALFQALMLMGLANTDILAALVTQVQQQQQAPPPMSYQQPVAPPQAPYMPPQAQAYPQQGYVPPQQQYATPPPHQQAYAAPPTQPAPYGIPPGMDPSVIEVVRNLSAQQFASLDDNGRDQVMKLRMAIGLPPAPTQ